MRLLSVVLIGLGILMFMPGFGIADEVAEAKEKLSENPESVESTADSDGAITKESQESVKYLPQPYFRAVGEDAQYKPLASWRWDELELSFPLSFSSRMENASGFQVDRNDTQYTPSMAILFQSRIGMIFDTNKEIAPFNIRLEFEHDFISGVVLHDDTGLDAVDLPNSDGFDWQRPRKAMLRASYANALTIGGGFMTSHWGLGLLANDGAHGWTPGSAMFSAPMQGDVVLRGFIATGPYTDYNLMVAGFFDKPWEDEDALEGGGMFSFNGGDEGKAGHYQGGIYGVYREEEADDGDVTKVTVLDLYSEMSWRVATDVRLIFAEEGAVIWGTTEKGPNATFQTHDVTSLGLITRFGVDGGIAGGWLDLFYASGDQNHDDDQQNAFHADVNFEYGLLFYRYIQAAQTGRGSVTAADPTLVGVPAEDLEEIASDGEATNTIAFFPKFWVRPVDGLEFYGGPLVAFTAVDMADPFNTRLAGGDPRNALNGDPGTYLGTELDLGVRFTTLLVGTQLMLGMEGGYFIPGDALKKADGSKMDKVYGGRAMIEYLF